MPARSTTRCSRIGPLIRRPVPRSTSVQRAWMEVHHDEHSTSTSTTSIHWTVVRGANLRFHTTSLSIRVTANVRAGSCEGMVLYDAKYVPRSQYDISTSLLMSPHPESNTGDTRKRRLLLSASAFCIHLNLGIRSSCVLAQSGMSSASGNAARWI